MWYLFDKKKKGSLGRFAVEHFSTKPERSVLVGYENKIAGYENYDFVGVFKTLDDLLNKTIELENK